jgi:hypothetical protein
MLEAYPEPVEGAMARLGCTCGHVIRDQTDAIPYKGVIVRDQHIEPFIGECARRVGALIAALQAGTRTTWLQQTFSAEYPTDLPDEAVVHDLITSLLLRKYGSNVYQCEMCGRLWVQDPHGTEQFRAFAPEGIWEGTLAVPIDRAGQGDDEQPV